MPTTVLRRLISLLTRSSGLVDHTRWIGHVREHVGLGLIHRLGDLGELPPVLIGQSAPLRLCLGVVLLGEVGEHHCRDHALVALGHIGEDAAQEVRPAALPARVEHLADGAFEPW